MPAARPSECNERQEKDPTQRSLFAMNIDPAEADAVDRSATRSHSPPSPMALRPLPSARLLMCMVRAIWHRGVYLFFVATTACRLVTESVVEVRQGHSPEGTIMTTSRMMMPAMRHMRIFMSFHHICLRTRLAPLRKPWADTARLSVLSCRESRRAPRSETLLMLSRMMPTVLSISWHTSQQCVHTCL
jgi:hypothetical protein